MKNFFLLVLPVVMVSAILFAQPTPGPFKMTTGSGSTVAPAIDALGAHNNYGRGCADCHAPHSGGYGAGGNGASGTVTDTYTGANALFAQDMGPLWGKTFDFSDLTNSGSANKYLFATPASGAPTSWTGQQYSDVRGIVMCLACHDGSVAKGAMMQNWAYEQQINALPSTYGSGKIPTLLGADGSSGGYNNDHPIGENATINAVLGAGYYGTGNGLTYVIGGTGPNQTITSITAGGQYSQFMTSYGAPALMKGAHSYPTPVNAAGVPYLVCTTCHDQHSMNVYAASANSPIANAATGTYAKFFFINGPYNLNTVSVPIGSAQTTTQFCRQCHFGESNEANGGTLPTVF